MAAQACSEAQVGLDLGLTQGEPDPEPAVRALADTARRTVARSRLPTRILSQPIYDPTSARLRASTTSPSEAT